GSLRASLHIFGAVGAVLFGAGAILGFRFLWKWFGGEGDGHVQSVILAGVLLGMGFQTFLVAFLGDLLAANRKLLEDVRIRLVADRFKEGGSATSTVDLKHDLTK